MKKRIISTVFIIFIFSNLISAEQTDSTFTSIEYLSIYLGRYSNLINPAIIRSQAEYDSLTTELKEKYSWLEEDPPEIDFEHFTLVGDESCADCVASFSDAVQRDTTAHSVIITIIEHYGGGRGMNVFDHWFLIKKMPEDFPIEFRHEEGEPKYHYED